jgi:hypothetical protein
MIIIIDGDTGSGKTYLMSLMTKKEWDDGFDIHPNFPIWFDEEATSIFRWHFLEETFGLTNGILLIDDAQRLMEARRWQSLPMGFLEKVNLGRHAGIDIITTTPNFRALDVRVRDNAHEIYRVQSLIRIPRNERVEPLIQISRYVKKIKKYRSENLGHKWVNSGGGHYLFISKLWTKKTYETYTNFGLSRYLTKIIQKQGTWMIKVYNRQLVNAGKCRL